jgi:hypothetical protein
MAAHTYDTTSVEATHLRVAMPTSIISSGVKDDTEVKANSDITSPHRYVTEI